MRNTVYLTWLLVSIASMQVTTASASTYFALEGTSVSLHDNSDDEFNPTGMRFRLGTPIGENLDVEAHVGFGGADLVSEGDTFATAFAGIYLKGYLPLGYNSAFYALGGYSGLSLMQSVGGREFTDEKYGFSYGAGLETKISERTDLTADYIRYVRDEGVFEDISAVSFGIKFYF